MWNIFKRKPVTKKDFIPLSMEELKSPKLTPCEKRRDGLKVNIGKPIILWKAKTMETTITRDPQYAYTQDAASYRYVSHYEDHIHDNITSAETIEGILEDVTTEMIKVNNVWYTFGYGAEKIYEYKFEPINSFPI